MKKINLQEALKFGGIAVILATAFWCPNAQKVLILAGGAAVTIGYFWSRLTN